MRHSILVLGFALAACSAGNSAKNEPAPTAPAESFDAGSASDAGPDASPSQSSQGIRPSLFGFVVNNANDTTPQLPMGTWRIWDDQAQWPVLEPADGTFVWDALDKWLAAIQANHVSEVLYTFMRVPDWAANPNDQLFNGQPVVCNYTPIQQRACYPMKDLADDGTGTDAIWRKAVAAIATHIVQGLPKGTPISWSLWDEIYRSTTLVDPSKLDAGTKMSWEGTYPQLVRAYQDASCLLTGHAKKIAATNESCSDVLSSVGLSAPIAPDSIVLAPGGSGVLPYGFTVVQQFLYCNVAGYPTCTTGSAGADAIDGINFEHYVWSNLPFEDALAFYQTNIAAILQPAEKAKPIFSAEGGWGGSLPAITDDPLKRAYIGRYFLMLASNGVTHGVWYAYDEPTEGGLFDPDTNSLVGGAVAWKTVYQWLVGSTITAPCAKTTGTFYSCGLTLSDGRKALALWDSASTCDENACTTTSAAVPAGGYTEVRDLGGGTSAISGSKVDVGLQPILLVE